MLKGILVLLAFLLTGAVQAQMPHRVAVLVNENSQNSKKAAGFFMALHGVPGLVNLFGIESPGLTSSLAMAEQVAELLAEPLG